MTNTQIVAMLWGPVTAVAMGYAMVWMSERDARRVDEAMKRAHEAQAEADRHRRERLQRMTGREGGPV